MISLIILLYMVGHCVSSGGTYLIDTDPECLYDGHCPQSTIGDISAIYPNQAERFYYTARNFARMYPEQYQQHRIGGARYSCYGEDVKYSVYNFCGVQVKTWPVLWLSSGNAVSRFLEWCKKPENCEDLGGVTNSAHYTCSYYCEGENAIFEFLAGANPCGYVNRVAAYLDRSKYSIGAEGIFNTNMGYFSGGHCSASFNPDYTYAGIGALDGGASVAHVWIGGEQDLNTPLVHGMHYDQRQHSPSDEYIYDDATNALNLGFIVEYFAAMNDAGDAQVIYLLYDGAVHQMSLVSGTTHGNGFWEIQFADLVATDCKPYAFVAVDADDNIWRLPMDDNYYFGTAWTRIAWPCKNSGSVNHKADRCLENHYYYRDAEWKPNASDRTDTDAEDCVGCDAIPALQQLYNDIKSGNIQASSTSSTSSTSTTSTTSTSSTTTTAGPTSSVIVTTSQDDCPSSSGTTATSCSSDQYKCVTFTGWQNSEWNGEWQASADECFNSRSYYTHSGLDGVYLCLLDSSHWIITTQKCDENEKLAYCERTRGDIGYCTGDAWTLYGSTTSSSTTSTTTSTAPPATTTTTTSTTSTTTSSTTSTAPASTTTTTTTSTTSSASESCSAQDIYKCLTFSGFGNDDWNGEWHANSDACFNSKSYYTRPGLNGVYLCLLDSHHWIITTEKCDETAKLAYCERIRSSVSFCTGDAWSLYDGSSETSSVSVVRSTDICASSAASSNEGNGIQCDEYISMNCPHNQANNYLQISGMELAQGTETTDYNGKWQVSGCYKNKPYWTPADLDKDAYLCYNKKWIITQRLCSSTLENRKVYCKKKETDIFAACVNNMKVQTRYSSGTASYMLDTSVSIINAKCTDPEAFTFEDNECLANNAGYTDEVCMSAESEAAALLFDETEANFVVYSDVCVNSKPVYSYTVYSETDEEDIYEDEDITVVDEEGNNIQESSVEKKYFLHYNMIGEWVITGHRISEIGDDRLAVCHYENLMECDENSWFVHNITITESTSGAGNFSMSETVMIIKEIEDQTMAVNEHECGWEQEEEEEQAEKVGSNSALVSTVILIVVLFILVNICVCGCIWYKKRHKMRGKVEWKEDDHEAVNTEIEVLETGVTHN